MCIHFKILDIKYLTPKTLIQTWGLEFLLFSTLVLLETSSLLSLVSLLVLSRELALTSLTCSLSVCPLVNDFLVSLLLLLLLFCELVFDFTDLEGEGLFDFPCLCCTLSCLFEVDIDLVGEGDLDLDFLTALPVMTRSELLTDLRPL